MSNVLQFYKVDNPSLLIPILKLRHPHSCFIYNQALQWKKFQETVKFFTIRSDITENTWILTRNDRKVYGTFFCISAPTSITLGQEKVPKEIQSLFASSVEVINWDEGLTFVALEKSVSEMIQDISINEKGNVTEVHPDNLYYMEIEDALKLKIELPKDGQIRPLSTKNKEEHFIAVTWKYFLITGEAPIQKDIESNPSSGIFLGKKCVSGAMISGYGLISALYTLQEHRQKGLARLTMNHLFLECAKQGLIPALSVEMRNLRSRRFNEKLGVKMISHVNWVEVKKLEID